jgi:hypothetical protein
MLSYSVLVIPVGVFIFLPSLFFNSVNVGAVEREVRRDVNKVEQISFKSGILCLHVYYMKNNVLRPIYFLPEVAVNLYLLSIKRPHFWVVIKSVTTF